MRQEPPYMKEGNAGDLAATRAASGQFRGVLQNHPHNDDLMFLIQFTSPNLEKRDLLEVLKRTKKN